MSVDLEKPSKLIIERAKQLVYQLIQKRNHDSPPFLSEEMAYLVGVSQILKEDLGKTLGVLMRLQDKTIIKINQKQSLPRQNFSCAHEIGHLLYNELGLEKYLSNIEYRTFNPQAIESSRKRCRERLCDIAATELIMPEFIFRRYLNNYGVTINSIEKLSNLFLSSIQATAIRVSELSIKPCITLKWQKRNRKNKSLYLSWSSKKPVSKINGKIVHDRIMPPSQIHKAYDSNYIVKCYRLFKVGKETKRWPLESKGFGHGENRFVISIAFPEN